MRCLLAFLLVFPLTLLGATGDITGVAIETNGFQALIYIENLSTNGTFFSNLGLGSNNSLTGSEKLKINVTSPGYDSTGSTITRSRIIYGTKPERFPYPSQAYNDTTYPVAGTVMLRVDLNDAIYSGDTVVSAIIGASLYTQGSASASSTWNTVTNSSLVPYPKVIAEWSCAPHNYVTGPFAVNCIAYHAYGSRGRPVACVQFITSDQTGHPYTNTVSDLSLVRGSIDMPCWPRYESTVATAGFDAANYLYSDFVAYPWIGDSSSIFDTRSATASFYGTTITNFFDPANSIGGPVYAVLDSAGNNATGIVTNNLAIAEANPFSTAWGAFTAIAATNNSRFSRKNLANSTLYVKAGTYDLWGAVGTLTGDSAAQSWFTIKSDPGVSSPRDVLFVPSATANDRKIPCRYVKLDGITITNNNVSGGLFRNSWGGTGVAGDRYYFTNSVFLQPTGQSNPLKLNNSPSFAQGCTITNGGGSVYSFNLSTGNRYQWIAACGYLYGCIAGNTFDLNTNSITKIFGEPASGSRYEYGILTCNMFRRSTAPSATIGGVAAAWTNGVAIVQNLMEKIDEGSASVLLGICADSNACTGSTNMLIVNNTFAGQRCNIGYNETGSTAYFHNQYWLRGNIFYYVANKNDVYGTDGNLFGGWWVSNAVGQNGNYLRTQPFQQQYAGVSGNFFDPAVSPEGYVLDASATGTSLGFGDYKLRSDSISLLVGPGDYFVPWDIEGQCRGLLDPPGAYASSCPRKGAGFFSP